MDKFFFSEKNVSRQCETLEKLLNIKNNPESKRKCKKFLVRKMQDTYEKHGKTKPNNLKVPEFLDLLNKKSIKDCVKIYEENKKNNKKQYKTNQLGEMKHDRDQEIYGQRTNQVQKRPQYPSLEKKNINNNNNNQNPNLPSYSDGTSSNNFAPLPQGNGEFITATGEMGSKMFFGDLENQMYGKRSDSKDDLERKLFERMGQYDKKGRGDGQGMPGMEGMGMMGMNGKSVM